MSAGRTGAIGAVLAVALLATGAPAAAKVRSISGTLSQPGYEVFALAESGGATSALAGPGFRVRPSAKHVALHLRAPDGTYAGPVVVATERKGKRAVLGVEAGTRLGEVKIKAARGYARLAGTLPDASLDTTQQARAQRGVPLGAGSFGYVRSKGGQGPAADRDLDGLPTPLDVDDDGDLVLDNLDASATGRRARAERGAGGCGPNNVYCQTTASGFAPIGLDRTVNVNALGMAGLTPEQIAQRVDATLVESGNLRFSPLSDSAELDCGGEPDPANPEGWIGGLTYCTRGGTGVASAGGAGPPFPGPPGGQFDPDGDGFGTFPKPSFIAHRATTAQIKTGDQLTQRDIVNGIEITSPATLNFVFVTVPALVSYSDTAGNCAKVAGSPGNCATTFSYPVPPGGPGSFGNGFPVSAPPGEDVVVTLTFWRPQRQAIPNDPPTAQWMDIGHLTYSAYAPAAGHPAIAGGCPQSTFSTTDANLAPPAVPLLGTGGLQDQTDDQESSPGNTITYTLNVSQCLAANGLSFNPGEEQMINFMAVAGATDTAEQTGITFRRQ